MRVPSDSKLALLHSLGSCSCCSCYYYYYYHNNNNYYYYHHDYYYYYDDYYYYHCYHYAPTNARGAFQNRDPEESAALGSRQWEIKSTRSKLRSKVHGFGHGVQGFRLVRSLWDFRILGVSIRGYGPSKIRSLFKRARSRGKKGPLQRVTLLLPWRCRPWGLGVQRFRLWGLGLRRLGLRILVI